MLARLRYAPPMSEQKPKPPAPVTGPQLGQPADVWSWCPPAPVQAPIKKQ